MTPSSDTPDLLPCPFCGHRPVVMEMDNGWAIDCARDSCPTQPQLRDQYHRREQAVAVWNHRAAPASDPPRLSECLEREGDDPTLAISRDTIEAPCTKPLMDTPDLLEALRTASWQPTRSLRHGTMYQDVGERLVRWPDIERIIREHFASALDPRREELAAWLEQFVTVAPISAGAKERLLEAATLLRGGR